MSQTPSIRTRLVHQLITFGALFQRPMTLGVRGLIIDKDERILLVKHTYVTGFYLPGGGVEPGETIVQALERELREECAISLKSPPLLHNIYLNKRSSLRDHVALFLIRDFSDEGPRLPIKRSQKSNISQLMNYPMRQPLQHGRALMRSLITLRLLLTGDSLAKQRVKSSITLNQRI